MVTRQQTDSAPRVVAAEDRPPDGSRSDAHPHGAEVRIYPQRDFHYSRVHPTIELAELEADERLRELLETCWTGLAEPPHPTAVDDRAAGP